MFWMDILALSSEYNWVIRFDQRQGWGTRDKTCSGQNAVDNNFYQSYHPSYVIHHSSLLLSTLMVQAVHSFNIQATTWDNMQCYSPKDDCKWIPWFVLWDGNFPVAYVFILETWEDRSYSM